MSDWAHNRSMSTENVLLTSFNELSSQARILFFLYTSSALIRYGAPPPDQAKMTALLTSTWETNHFTLQDLSDPHCMTPRLKAYFASPADSKKGNDAG
jgi:hypothetical protein